jgi:hypothetical protein
MFQFRLGPGTRDPVWRQSPCYFRHGTVFRDLGNARLRGVGVWLSFSRRMAEANPESQIWVLMLAVNGSALNQWAKDGELYFENLRLIMRAIGDGVILKGMIWIHGESGTGVQGSDYGEMFQGFRESIRADLDKPTLPVVAGILSAEVPYAEEVSRALGRLDRKLSELAVVDVPEKTQSDKVHFGTKTSEKLGIAMAVVMHRLQAKRDQSQ